jgi:putative hydrolase
MPPGTNPFEGFDLTELVRMLQSPGPVNMEVARKTAEATATLDLDSGHTTPDDAASPDVVRAFDDVVRAVQLSVSEATGIASALAVPARCVTRREWTHSTLSGLEPVLGTLATALRRDEPAPSEEPALSPDALLGMLVQQLVPVLLGGWAGSMIGYLSHHALGQYDLPLPLAAAPEMLFVAQNVDGFARAWTLADDELRYALALREAVHGAQRSIPWVRDRLVALSSSYVDAYEVRADALEEHFGEIDPSDPSSMAGLEGLADPQVLLGAMQSERQAPILEELQRFASVLEGYTDVVVAMLGTRMVSSHARIDEALRRHRLERGAAGTFVDRLLGLELERDHYEAGLAFCQGVVDRSDGRLDELNRIWARAELLPTGPELDAPGLWLARIDLPES